MKKNIINAILIAIFILLSAILVRWFAADWQFNKAKKAKDMYLWQLAEKKYAAAIRLSPFNAEYYADYAEFLYQISSYQKEKETFLSKAETLYLEAIKLNPYCAHYHLGLGLVYLKENRRALNELIAAVSNDPNDADINYAAGAAALSLWNNLDAQQRTWVLNRLKFSLKIKPEYEKNIYPQLWLTTNDSALLSKIRPEESAQEKKEKNKRIEKIKQENNTRSWQGKSKNGEIYENGNMYWEGTIYKLIDVPDGRAIINLQAKGSKGGSVWPHMIIELDGVNIGETFVDNPDYKVYDFQTVTNAGTKVLSVTFTNDAENGKEDRNLYLGEVKVE